MCNSEPCNNFCHEEDFLCCCPMRHCCGGYSEHNNCCPHDRCCNACFTPECCCCKAMKCCAENRHRIEELEANVVNLDTRIENEEIIREQHDNDLGERISSLASKEQSDVDQLWLDSVNQKSLIDGLREDLNAEINRSTEKDQQHDNSILNNADAIQIEQTRAQGVEQDLNNAIAQEEARATNAELGLQDAINGEISRAKAAEKLAVTNVAYNTNTKFITKTIDNQTSNVVQIIPASDRGASDGVAPLTDGKIPSTYLPSYVDDVIEYNGTSNPRPAQGETGKIYVDTDTNLTYRWTGSTYVEISKSLVTGTTQGTAYDGAAGNALNNDINGTGGLKSRMTSAENTISGINGRVLTLEGANYVTDVTKDPNNSNNLKVTYKTGNPSTITLPTPTAAGDLNITIGGDTHSIKYFIEDLYNLINNLSSSISGACLWELDSNGKVVTKSNRAAAAGGFYDTLIN